MTELEDYRSDARFVGIMSFVASSVFGALTLSTWVFAVLLAITSVSYLIRPYKVPKWRVIVSFALTGLILSIGCFYMRSRGMSI